MARQFELVDVFGAAPFSGNPLAVVHAAEGLDDASMARITQWLNLSETTFLLPPTEAGADYRVRIFTIGQELPFAGHPTLGTCHAWLRAGGVPRRPGVIVQQCGVGLVELRQSGGRLAFAAPKLIRSGALTPEERDTACAIAGVAPAQVEDAAWVDNGPGWCALLLRSAADVLAAKPAFGAQAAMNLGLIGPHAAGQEAAWEVRGLFNAGQSGLREDPVTGSLNASLAQWLFAAGRARGAYVAAQGTVLGFAGRVHAERDAAGQVWIGGQTVTLVEGALA